MTPGETNLGKQWGWERHRTPTHNPSNSHPHWPPHPPRLLRESGGLGQSGCEAKTPEVLWYWVLSVPQKKGGSQNLEELGWFHLSYAAKPQDGVESDPTGPLPLTLPHRWFRPGLSAPTSSISFWLWAWGDTYWRRGRNSFSPCPFLGLCLPRPVPVCFPGRQQARSLGLAESLEGWSRSAPNHTHRGSATLWLHLQLLTLGKGRWVGGEVALGGAQGSILVDRTFKIHEAKTEGSPKRNRQIYNCSQRYQ